jgi:hypothetical protein
METRAPIAETETSFFERSLPISWTQLNVSRTQHGPVSVYTKHLVLFPTRGPRCWGGLRGISISYAGITLE